MGETSIEWADFTFNPWIGCTKVSRGCTFCYADRDNNHYQWNPAGWGPHAPRKRTSVQNWKKPLKWNKDAEAEGVKKHVFCASLADVMDDHWSISSEWRRDLYDLVDATPNLIWMFLTKRPENLEEFTPTDWLVEFPSNVWLGISAEDQESFDKRWPVFEEAIRYLRAPVSFLSLEPLLEGIDISAALTSSYFGGDTRAVDWVIAGAESGTKPRDVELDAFRDLRDQCVKADVDFFLKQVRINEQLVKMPVLDGVVWNQRPE